MPWVNQNGLELGLKPWTWNLAFDWGPLLKYVSELDNNSLNFYNFLMDAGTGTEAWMDKLKWIWAYGQKNASSKANNEVNNGEVKTTLLMIRVLDEIYVRKNEVNNVEVLVVEKFKTDKDATKRVMV
ncbi:hypothetical protein V6N11_018306 [Hibiscus sabdariffa]|uniref:Uncharacterized protein n=1 Tax=Hibiscus sabdariffa TaxID=183260 RepID=A0ABR2T704_9ROSI